MKVLLTGATGFVGKETLARLERHAAISQILCLTRRAVSTSSSKVATLLQPDFSRYDNSLLNRLATYDACIWALGAKASDVETSSELERVTHRYALELAGGIASHTTKPFTFCYVSGMGADPTETSWLPWEKETRHLKGRAEKDLLLLQEKYPDFTAHCFRPGGILPRTAPPWQKAFLSPITVDVRDLASALIRAALRPDLRRHLPVVSNAEIKRLSRM